MCNGNIPDLWPSDDQGLIRALYNIALNRVCPGQPPENESAFINATVDGKPYRLRIRASTGSAAWSGVAIAEDDLAAMDEEATRQQLPVRLLAVWRHPSRGHDHRTIHTWLIPDFVVKNSLRNHEPARHGNADGRWRVSITRPHGSEWVWNVIGGGGRRAEEYFSEWDLTDEELACIPPPANGETFNTPTAIIWSDGKRDPVRQWRQVMLRVTGTALERTRQQKVDNEALGVTLSVKPKQQWFLVEDHGVYVRCGAARDVIRQLRKLMTNALAKGIFPDRIQVECEDGTIISLP